MNEISSVQPKSMAARKKGMMIYRGWWNGGYFRRQASIQGAIRWRHKMARSRTGMEREIVPVTWTSSKRRGMTTDLDFFMAVGLLLQGHDML